MNTTNNPAGMVRRLILKDWYFQRWPIFGFLRDRLLRLGVPFLVMAGLLAPLAYYPTYRLTGADPSPGAFWTEWFSIDGWPAGPAWFLWVLLALSALGMALTRLAPTWGETLGRWTGRLSRSPLIACLALIAISALAYLPLAAIVSPVRWDHLGPSWIQTSRSLHYAVYFLAGIGLGAGGLDRGLFAQSGRLARRWWHSPLGINPPRAPRAGAEP